jgi:hypothetical protein
MRVDRAGRTRPYTDAERASLERARVWLGRHPVMVAGGAPASSGPLRVETDDQATARVAAHGPVSAPDPALVAAVTDAARGAVAGVLRRRAMERVLKQSALKGWYLR